MASPWPRVIAAGRAEASQIAVRIKKGRSVFDM
jgi:hypothetical protein